MERHGGWSVIHPWRPQIRAFEPQGQGEPPHWRLLHLYLKACFQASINQSLLLLFIDSCWCSPSPSSNAQLVREGRPWASFSLILLPSSLVFVLACRLLPFCSSPWSTSQSNGHQSLGFCPNRLRFGMVVDLLSSFLLMYGSSNSDLQRGRNHLPKSVVLKVFLGRRVEKQGPVKWQSVLGFLSYALEIYRVDAKSSWLSEKLRHAQFQARMEKWQPKN